MPKKRDRTGFKRPEIKPATHAEVQKMADEENKPIWLVYDEAVKMLLRSKKGANA